MKQAVIYARVSSKEQEREGFSIPAQFAIIEEYAKRHNLQVIQRYHEAETAKKSGREKFAEMVSFLLQQKTQTVLLVEKTDRLYRNFKDFVLIDDLINSKNHEVHLVKESVIIGINASSHDKFVHGIKVVLAKNYIDNLSEETKKGTRQKLEGGGWAHLAPYGYLNARKTILVDPEQAQFVKAAYDLYSSHLYSLERLVNVLFEKGYVYKANKPKIPKQSLEYMLKNNFYIGEMESHGQIYQGSHEPIIDHDTWIQAQRALRRDGKPRTFEAQAFKYSGLLFCGECNSAYVGERKKEGRYIYYRCCSKKRGCSQGYVNETKITAQVENILKTLIIPPDIKEMVLSVVKQQETLMEVTNSEEKGIIDERIKRLRDSYKKALHEKIRGTIDEEMWLEVSQDFQMQIRQEEAKKTGVELAIMDYSQLATDLVELPEMITRKWFHSDEEQKRTTLNLIGSNFMMKDGNISYKLKEPFSLFANQALCIKWCTQPDFIRILATLQPAISRAKNLLMA